MLKIILNISELYVIYLAIVGAWRVAQSTREEGNIVDINENTRKEDEYSPANDLNPCKLIEIAKWFYKYKKDPNGVAKSVILKKQFNWGLRFIIFAILFQYILNKVSISAIEKPQFNIFLLLFITTILIACFWRWFKSKKEDVILAANIFTIIAFIFILYAFFSGNVQTQLLKEQVISLNTLSVPQLADRCVWYNRDGGDRASYDILLSKEKETDDGKLHTAIVSQIERIKDVYLDAEMNDTVKKFYIAKFKRKDDKLIEVLEKEYPAEYVIGHITETNGYHYWRSRAKAAYLLRNIVTAKWEEKIDYRKAMDAIVMLLEDSEYSLLVSRVALDTYKHLTGFKSKSNDPFDFKGARDHWNEGAIFPEVNKMLVNRRNKFLDAKKDKKQTPEVNEQKKTIQQQVKALLDKLENLTDRWEKITEKSGKSN